MTETLPRLDEPGDAELISAVRGGDVSAYGGLFERHVGAARRLARQLVGPADADDLVSDAYVKVLRVLQNGGGPDIAFRAYLLTAIRRLHVDKMRAGARLHSTDDMEAFDPGVPFRDTAVEGFENAAAAKAFASLPERWQLVLWHTEVEGQKPAEVAALLGISPNSVSALAYRAREGLRQAFLNSHAAEIDDAACSWTHEHLGAYIRNGVSKRDASKVEKHLDECRKCMAIYLELTEVNSNLGGILAPLLLGGAGLGYLGGAGGVAAKGGLVAMFDRARDAVVSNGQAAAVAGVAAATVIAAATIAMIAGGGDDADPAAKSPTSSTTSSSAPSDSPVIPAQPPAQPVTPPSAPGPADTASPPVVGTGGQQSDETAPGSTGADVQDVGSTDDQTGTGDEPGTSGGGSANTAPSRKSGAPTSVTVRAGQTATFVVDDYATDADGDPLSFVNATATNGEVTGVALARGRATSATSAEGSRLLSFRPRDGFSGDAVVQFDVTDGQAETHFRVGVVVSPVAANDTHRAAADTRVGYTVLPLLRNDQGSGLRFIGTDPVEPGNLVRRVNGQVRYVYAPDYSGTDSFTYVVSDSTGRRTTARATVTITNQAPVVTPQGMTPIEVQVGGEPVEVATYQDANHDDVRLNDADPAHGALSVEDGLIEYSAGSGAPVGVIDRFTYSVVDRRGGASQSRTALVVLLRTPVPDPDPTNGEPVATGDSVTTGRDVPVTIDVLANDSDPDADKLSVTGTSQPANGAADINADTTITYTPDRGFTGTDSFTYTLSDGRGGTAAASVTVTVTEPPNNPPVADDDQATTAMGEAVTIDVLDGDSDPDGDTLRITSTDQPANGTAVLNSDNTITYTPDDGFTGTDTFDYTISDGRGGTDTGTVSVSVQHDLTVTAEARPVGDGVNTDVTVRVEGLSPNGSAIVRLGTDGVLFLSARDQATRSRCDLVHVDLLGLQFGTCTIEAGDPRPLEFRVRNLLDATTLAVTVEPAEGTEDAHPDNNTAVVDIPGGPQDPGLRR